MFRSHTGPRIKKLSKCVTRDSVVISYHLSIKSTVQTSLVFCSCSSLLLERGWSYFMHILCRQQKKKPVIRWLYQAYPCDRQDLSMMDGAVCLCRQVWNSYTIPPKSILMQPPSSFSCKTSKHCCWNRSPRDELMAQASLFTAQYRFS